MPLRISLAQVRMSSGSLAVWWGEWISIEQVFWVVFRILIVLNPSSPALLPQAGEGSEMKNK